LYAAWGGPRQWREIRPAGHDSIADAPDYWQAIADFLEQLR
jgi:pimeloyl-ACP methyl ester carboxylesterase